MFKPKITKKILKDIIIRKNFKNLEYDLMTLRIIKHNNILSRETRRMMAYFFLRSLKSMPPSAFRPLKVPAHRKTFKGVLGVMRSEYGAKTNHNYPHSVTTSDISRTSGLNPAETRSADPAQHFAERGVSRGTP